MTEVLSDHTAAAPESVLALIPRQRTPTENAAVGGVVLELPDGGVKGGEDPQTSTSAGPGSSDVVRDGTPRTDGGRPNYGPGHERGEDAREVIAICDFHDFYTGGNQPGRPVNIYAIEDEVDHVLGADGVGYYIRLILREMRHNYKKYCGEDIEEGTDSGQRTFEVSRTIRWDGGAWIATDEVHVDYWVRDLIYDDTYNIYAVGFGQDPIPEVRVNPKNAERKRRAAEEAAAKAEASTVEATTVEAEPADEGVVDYEEAGMSLHDLLKGAGVDVDNLDLDAIEAGLLLGNESEEGGRGIPIMLRHTKFQLIERFGDDGRGAHIHLIMKPDEELRRQERLLPL